MYVATQYQSVLKHNGLNTFQDVWGLQVGWLEQPNQHRGGWSGVSRTKLILPQGGEVVVYLKRQQNFTRRSLRHPFSGEATFEREMVMISRLQHHNIPTLKPVLFGVEEMDDDKRAILMTEELSGYRSLDELVQDGTVQGMSLREKRQLLSALADVVRRMHAAHIQHRSLYAKHLFVRKNDGYEVAIIDLEKSRLALLPLISMFSDLITLNYRTDGWSRTSRLYFYLQYCGGDSLSMWQKLWCRYIVSRTNKKRSLNREGRK